VVDFMAFTSSLVVRGARRSGARRPEFYRPCVGCAWRNFIDHFTFQKLRGKSPSRYRRSESGT
jgi:hypothetical protein